MKWRIGVFAAILFMVCLAAVLSAVPQESPDNSNKHDDKITIQLKFSAESNPSIPSESKIQWQTVDETCKQTSGGQPLRPNGELSLKVPVCKIKILIFIKGFNTKTATVDLVANEEKYNKPIRIAVTYQGPPLVEW